MQTFHNPLHAQHAGRFEMFRGQLVPCHEVPNRVDFVLAELQRRQLGRITAPALDAAALATSGLAQALAAVHQPRYLSFIETAWSQWVALNPVHATQDALPSVWPVRGFRADVEPDNFAARMGLYSFDAGSPLTAGTWAAAQAGAACALAAAHAVLGGARSAFALTRPPGHHAGPDFFGGYCFINNAAVAAHTLRQRFERVAVLDVDYHHGNGTQSIFYSRPDVLTVSLHGDPRTEYPFFLGHPDERGEGAGLGANLNLPLPRGTGFGPWHDTLLTALEAVRQFGAQALVVPLGVDTFAGDPISGFGLQSADYLSVGQTLAGLGLPTVFTFEGGYAVAEVGTNTANVLQGFDGTHRH
jgi:acetoin utilization deacetylase AcuC-like enzyme